MLKEKLDFKLVNLALIALVLFLVYLTGSLWTGIINSIWRVTAPFFIAFIIAYALNPLVLLLRKKNVSKKLSVTIVMFGFLATIGVIVSLVFPLLFNQIVSFLNGITAFVRELNVNYDLNLGPIQESLNQSFDSIIKSVSSYVSNGAIKTLGMSLNFLANAVITLSAAAYFLADFDNLREFFKMYMFKKSQRTSNYLKSLDHEFRKYITGMLKVMLISIVEYTIAFYIIGHPNALLLGFLAAPANLIPFFGGLMNNILAMITAFVIGPALFLRTVITSFILSGVDSYVINPAVYGQSNEIHPLVVIFAVFAGGSLFGPMGIFIALPTAIMFISAYKFFKDDIQEKLSKDKS
jgi:predicted PurR-regulated permease PerM